ncbi:MAG: thiamine biosynthesis protein ThiC, partial [Pseudomonadota bacterium]
ALLFGRYKARTSNGAGKILGTVTLSVGAIAILSNTAVTALGRGSLIPSPIAGDSGVVATLLLALCLSSALDSQP